MKGKVYLVGAGPGDYKLLTLKGLDCIREADVIVYDRLADVNYLKEAKSNCEFIYVGKASSQHTLPQEEINRVIADKVKEGKIVTRLKGGDPYVFGRGGEEGEVLKAEVSILKWFRELRLRLVGFAMLEFQLPTETMRHLFMSLLVI